MIQYSRDGGVSLRRHGVLHTPLSFVIASDSEAIQKAKELDCFVACAPLRKRVAFVAGNDGSR
jgi:hypothetical protein